jgi:exodeoxyribonuclease V alpha subunit
VSQNFNNITLPYSKPEGTRESVTGEVVTIIYFNEKNGFSVIKFLPNNQQNAMIVVGEVGQQPKGNWLQIEGVWEKSKKFGLQLKIQKWKTVQPQSTEGIIKFLGSGLIKGIGPSTAKRIVNKFGLKTLDILDKYPSRFKEIHGIGPAKSKTIMASWKEHREVSKIMVFLQGYGVPTGTAFRIYNKYKDDTISILTSNPYGIAGDIWGIGFKTADAIAFSMGISPDSIQRATAATLYALSKSKDDGHIFLPLDLLKEETKKIIYPVVPDFEIILDNLEKEKSIMVEENRIYLPKLFTMEKELAFSLIKLRNNPTRPLRLKKIDFDKSIHDMEDIALEPEQIRAVKNALYEKITIITGGPGTGKTTLINAIAYLSKKLKLKLILTAPTGRAAKRLKESTNKDASTIHRLLEYQPQKNRFAKNRDNPLDVNILVVDELSMVDLPLMTLLMRAIPPSATLVLVGDKNQLPSVGPGAVLNDLLKSGQINSVELKTIFRQAQESTIVKCSHEINKGQQISPGKGRGGDLFFIERSDPEEIANLITKLVTQNIPSSYGFSPLTDIQVLTPKHKGILGTQNLNINLQNGINPQGERFTNQGRDWRVGDKILQLKNNYDLQIFNGDLGIIKGWNSQENEVTILFDENEIVRPVKELSEMVLAYSISIHKSQGSEYPVVVIPIHTQHNIMLQRNLIYTAITRAKKLVVIVGTSKALNIAISNNFQKVRYSWLSNRIQQFSE